jgi:DNA polymerase III subunit epsilon
MLPNYVLLDLETTGATPLKDRITEIALIKFEAGREVSRWQTLVNPEAPIPAFIQKLTGIDNNMVANAPTFKEVAAELLDYLGDSVLCAHNVRFDHGFLKNEFKRIGVILRQKMLCTVKLSRKLYPMHRSHSLDSIISRHQLTCSARHRAMGDVEMMVGFISAANIELGTVTVRNAAEDLLKGSKSLPPHIDANLIDELPDTAGVYIFYGDTDLPLYIGKSINIRERVLSHFSADHASTKEMRISQEIKHIEWIETAGEFSALLLESKLIKERQPIHNRQLRREGQLCAWQISNNADTQPLVTLVRVDEIEVENIGQLFGTFRTKKHATEVLRKLAEFHQLCPRVLGLEAGKGACFSHQLKRCKGVCAGKESSEFHYLRLQQAMVSQRLKSWPYKGKIGICESESQNGKTAIHVFEHWIYLGTANDETELEQMKYDKKDYVFDLDSYKILNKELRNPKVKITFFGDVYDSECS